MTVGDSITDGKSPLHEYQNTWVQVQLGDRTYAGQLMEINDRFGSLVLSPYLKGQAISGALPHHLQVDNNRETIVYAGMPFSIRPAQKEDVDLLVQEAGRDFAAAWKEREQRLSSLKQGIEKQLEFPF